MTNEESQQMKAFIRSLMLNIRMNYGYAMTQAGIEDSVIINVHHMANDKMLSWLEAAH